MRTRPVVRAGEKASRATGAFLASAAVAWYVWTGVRSPKTPRPSPAKWKAEGEEDTPNPGEIPDPIESAPQMAPDIPQITRLPEIPAGFLIKAPTRWRSRAFIISLLLHCGFIWLLANPFDVEEERKAPTPRLSVHLLLLTPPENPLEKSSAPRHVEETTHSSGAFPKWRGASGTIENAKNAEPERENGSERRPFTLPPLPPAQRDEHTLVQPDLPPEIRPRENMSMPEAFFWAPREAHNLLIVPGISNPEPLTGIRPSIDVAAPQVRAPDIAAVRTTPAIATPELPVPRAPSTPASMASVEKENGLPEILSKAVETSVGHLISVTDVPLPPEARIVVPSVSQVAALKNPETKNVPAQPGGTRTENGNGAGGAEDVQRSVDRNGMNSAVNSDTGIRAVEGTAMNADATTGGQSSIAQLVDGQHTKGQSAATQSTREDFTRISRPPDGRHSSVVLGSQTSAAYPESAGVLNGKIVYTVYLQLGLRKNWILQFCLFSARDQQIQPNGSVPPIDPPWPYLMVRPPLQGLSGDYTLIHGLINPVGRFEQLAPLIHDGSAHDLLEALQQWEFRPASRNGSPVSVEILLIVPHPEE